MGLNKIEDRLSRIKSIVDDWRDTNSISRLERDLVLEELRRLYDAFLNVDEGESSSDDAAVESVETFQPVVPIVDVVRDVVDDFDDALDIDALLGLTDDDASLPAVEEVVAEPLEVADSATDDIIVEAVPAEDGAAASAVETAVDVEPQERVNEEQRAETTPGGGLFDLDDIPVASKSSRRMISLYNDAPKRDVVKVQEPVKATPVEVAPAVKEEVVATAPVAQGVDAAEPPRRIGDVLAGTVVTLADKMAGDDAPTTAFNRIADLRKAIGLNDKFLMIRDLFGGDAARYEDTIDTLNEFDDLDECMIYIVENFRWNPDSEGAKLLVSLLERKLA
ncbi:MAG: hypothetical protein J6V59_07115 [Alistipes sp.]|nr:hypothetical protein [Alistipes sp.]